MENTINPEKDRKESQEYCKDCNHCEMCAWYPHDGCEFRKISRKLDIKDLLADLNPNEIYAHDTEDSLSCFLSAWKVALLERIGEYERGEVDD